MLSQDPQLQALIAAAGPQAVGLGAESCLLGFFWRASVELVFSAKAIRAPPISEPKPGRPVPPMLTRPASQWDLMADGAAHTVVVGSLPYYATNDVILRCLRHAGCAERVLSPPSRRLFDERAVSSAPQHCWPIARPVFAPLLGFVGKTYQVDYCGDDAALKERFRERFFNSSDAAKTTITSYIRPDETEDVYKIIERSFDEAQEAVWERQIRTFLKVSVAGIRLPLPT
jgi:hypothetical protein